MDRRILGRHHRAERGRIGREQELVAERPFARRPEPVRDDHVGAAAHQRNLARLGRGKLGRLDVETHGLVEPARLDEFDLPGRRSRFLERDAQAIGGLGAERQARGQGESERGGEQAFDHKSAPHHPPRRISMPRAGS